MKINKTDNTNFKAIYRIPYSERIVSEIKQQIIPTYQKISNQPCYFFTGKNPFFDSLKIWINTIAKKNNSSVEWLKMNAKNHGGDVEQIEEGFVHIITGEKDIKAVNNYMQERADSSVEKVKQKIQEKFSIGHKIKTLFVGEEKPDLGYNENTPEHLKLLFQLIKQNKDETNMFNNAFPKIIEVKSGKELFTKIMNER